MTEKLSQARLKELVDYDPETGAFTWKGEHRGWRSRSAGCATGDGYWCITVEGKTYRAHRLAWLYANGAWPERLIDHINGDKTDNRLANLRDVENSTNCQNRRRPQSDNKSGFLGVHWCKSGQRWRAQIYLAGKLTRLGYFDSPEQAHEAYLTAKRQIHGGCTI